MFIFMIIECFMTLFSFGHIYHVRISCSVDIIKMSYEIHHIYMFLYTIENTLSLFILYMCTPKIVLMHTQTINICPSCLCINKKKLLSSFKEEPSYYINQLISVICFSIAMTSN